MKVTPHEGILILQIESPYETAFLAYHLNLLKKQDMAVAVFNGGDLIQIRPALTTDEQHHCAVQNQLLVEYINKMNSILSVGLSTEKIFEKLRASTAETVEKLKAIPVKDK